MRRTTIITIACLLLVAQLSGSAAVIRPVRVEGATTRPQTATGPAGTRKLSIVVNGGGWGNAGVVDIRKVLESTGQELWKYFPDRRLNKIIVGRGRQSPITLFRRGRNGEYFVKLNVQGRFWCQFAYQFAHELGHILANYSAKTPQANKWFEEMLCELASLFAMRKMAITWKTAPPYPHWKSYSSAIQKYVDDLTTPKANRLPDGTTLAAWYKANAAELRKNPCLRAKNRIVANRLLGLFESNPEGWAAVEFLNSGKQDSDKFQDYLSNWYRQTPARHRKFVASIIRLFELKVPKLPVRTRP